MITFTKFLEDFRGKVFGEDSRIKATVMDLFEYSKIEVSNPDLSKVSFDELVEIESAQFDSFTAIDCKFNGGFRMLNCQVKGNLYFQVSIVDIQFILSQVSVGGNLFYPENFPNLISGKGIKVSGLSVQGEVHFPRM